jgi:hypothetical protein
VWVPNNWKLSPDKVTQWTETLLSEAEIASYVAAYGKEKVLDAKPKGV